MKILVLYQDIQSGAKIATEAIIDSYRATYPTDTLVIYKQPAHLFSGRFSYVRNTMWSMWDYFKILQATHDVDLIFSTLYTYALPWRLSRHRSIPAIFQIHGDQRLKVDNEKKSPLSQIYRSLIKSWVARLQQFAINSATRVAFVSTASRKEFLLDTNALNIYKKTFIMPNGVNLQHFKPTKTIQKLALRKYFKTNDAICVGYIGRIDSKKGVHTIIQMLKYVLIPTAVWIVYPTPVDSYSRTYLATLKNLAARVHPRHMIRFIESPNRITDIYHNIDYLLLPSQQEMLPLVLLEALACGVIPLATGVGGVKEILLPISKLLILSSTSPRDLARHLQMCFRLSPKKHAILLQRGYDVATKYTWEQSASQLRQEGGKLTQR